MEYGKNLFRVVSNQPVTHKTFKMVLEGYTDDISAPGQFVNVAVEGKYLRRPISICDYEKDRLTLLYDVVGAGTEIMSKWEAGHEADILSPLGIGFDLHVDCERPILVGGGIGVAPLLKLGKELLRAGKTPVAVLGFNSAADISLRDELMTAGIETYISTVDGYEGTKGFVTDAIAGLQDEYDYYYACGPLPMLKALWHTLPVSGQLSLEARMGCGFGVCVCCSLETKDGVKRICKEGPVFRKEELIWK